MSDRPDESLTPELDRLHEEIRDLKQDQKAFEAQNELLRTFTNLMRTSTGSLMLRSVLQQTLKIAIRFTQAEEGSLFFLDQKGAVVASVLARGATIRDQKEAIIGQVLDQGLAGWVNYHRQVGLITDTKTDDRWLTLADEPYVVRSALGVPIFRRQTLLGILTLMHSEPGYFTPEAARLMEKTGEQMGVVLDNVRLYVEYQKVDPRSSKQAIASEEASQKESSNQEDSLANLGLYILTERSKFLYANRQLAHLFGYRFAELVGLDSFLDLMAAESKRAVFNQIQDCFQGDLKQLIHHGKGRCSDGKLIEIDLYAERTKLYGKGVLIGVVQPC
ncbi:GAF domain-containing protein [Roseofilum sp. BLCC_M91]|uniref:GAF domain-containing protein n=1 Tax=Roseofilum halophilum BLCC-M91 TaxID=3022259 RepID=A0ABT7BNA9_9CYAN|nr:GAF domain-containing protein [Roseofilum halophilum]MDJ1180676.1 GAF domain-containing protein [Roseofilum halophilum BLCC-M91]